jgi:hypothetical protein
MPPVTPSRKQRGLVRMSEAQNTVDALTSQQQTGISAPSDPGGPMSGQSNALVVLSGVIPSTPAGTPGPTHPRYGMCFYDSSGVLQVQIDQWGWHKYNNVSGVPVYASEIVTYS